MAGFPEVFSVCSTQLAYAFSDFLSSLTSALLVFLVPTNPDCAPPDRSPDRPERVLTEGWSVTQRAL